MATMDDKIVAEYFIVAGLPSNPFPLDDFSCDGATLKSTHSLPPITDIGVVNRSLGEVVPDDYTCIETTSLGLPANLNHGVLRSQEMFLCYRRGRDKSALFDIGVLFKERERLLPDSQVVEQTFGKNHANINPNGTAAYLTYRRASEKTPCNELVVSDICIIMPSKGEAAPHSYCTIDRNLNKGNMVGSDVFVCYRKSVNRTNYIAYKAEILDQYPMQSRPSFPVPGDLALLCLPMGATLEAWPPQADQPQPVFSTFVLTVAVASGGANQWDSSPEGVEKVYGAAVTFYEKYNHEQLSEDQYKSLALDDHFGCRNLVHTNKCICILSMWPFFHTFEKFLMHLCEISYSSGNKIPIERYIWHMLECVPFPTSRRPRILIQLDAKKDISLAQPEDSPIPISGAKFRKLVSTLRPEGCLQVLLYALTEQKLLLHSLCPDVLTSVAEAITMIIFPFHWQCPYIPLCPLGLSNILNAPIPFLLGLDSRFFDLYDPPSDVICVDLDTAAISVPEDKRFLTLKLLPKKYAKALRNSLEALCGPIKKFDSTFHAQNKNSSNIPAQNIDAEFKILRKEQELEVEIQETFLRFTASILRGYSQFLRPIQRENASSAPDTTSLFNIEEFVKTRDRSNQKFYEILVGTQMFSKFIEERSFVSDKNASLVFFDDCIEKVTDDAANLRLLEVEPASSEYTFFLPPPEPPMRSPVDGYAYKGFPKLRSELFPSKLPPIEASTPLKGFGAGTPGSPLARRSKHEVRSAQKMTYKIYQVPMKWAKCLLSSSFSVWFAQLPSFISVVPQKGKVLDMSFKVLQRMQKLSLSHHDEVCYRVMMQLCGVYSKPGLAVMTLLEMKNAGITPNAITYGYYNRAVLESKWNRSNLFWNKLRNVVVGVSAFRQSGIERAQRRRKSSLSLDEVDKLSTDADSTSRVSIDSSSSFDSHPVAQLKTEKTDTLSSDPGYCSISENCEGPSTTVSGSTQPNSMNPTATEMTRSASNNSVSGVTSPTTPQDLGILSTSTPSPSTDTSFSSPTAVPYDTAPSSPILSPTQPANVNTLPPKPPRNNSPSGKHLSSSKASPYTRACAKGLDFSDSDEFRRKRGSIIRSSTAGLSSGVQLSLLETRPILNSSAGLLMTSALDSSFLDPNRPQQLRPTDLAEALSPTLAKYDQIQEPSIPLPIDPSLVERGAPEYLSPSSFNYRKNELLSGGLSSMKSAVTSLSKKYNEIRDAIIATPSKNMSWRTEESCDEVEGFWGRRMSSDTNLFPADEIFSADGTTEGGSSDIDCPLRKSHQGVRGPFCLGMWITSCSKCHNCKGLLFDEEIMAGWSPDDSNLNTKCWHCEQMTVPLLTVTLYDLRSHSKQGLNEAFSTRTPEEPLKEDAPSKEADHLTKEKIVKCIQDLGEKLEPLTFPYLSPLVLRKELETMLGHDGDMCLTQSSFSEHHPILYWNMVWYFGRLKLPSHLAGLSLLTLPLLKEKDIHASWDDADWRNVYVRCLWDNPIYHQELSVPLYIQWKENYNPSSLIRALTPHVAKVSKDDLQSFLTLLHYNKVNRCLQMIVQILNKKPLEVKTRHYPIYRDLLFFACQTIPSEELDIVAFEQEFRREFDKLLHLHKDILRPSDGPPSVAAIFCRRYFRDLAL